MYNGEKNMISFLLIGVPLLLTVAYLVKKALQRSETYGILEKIEDDSHAYAVVRDLDVTQIKQQRAELERIKKELQ